MAQRITGAYRLITVPKIYKGLMRALGSERSIRVYVDDFLEPKPGDKILDVGCGPAQVLPYLPEVDYVGIDLNAKHIAYAREHFGTRGRFIVGNAAEDLHQEDGSFDLINVSALLHHLDDKDAIVLISGLKRLLKPGGRIVTFDNVHLPKQRLTVRLLNALDSGLNIRSPEGYVSLISGLGFEVKTHLFHDLLRIPYDHFIMIAQPK